ncbi:MAG: CHASE3 domain-containing protein, partial [Rhodanobacteraceae bacterium]
MIASNSGRRGRSRLGQWQYVLVALTALLVIGSAAISIAASYRQRERLHDIDRSQQTMAAAVQMLSLAKDAETGQRGYLITGDGAYLQPYNKAIADLGAARNTFAVTFTNEYPARVSKLRTINAVLDAKLSELARMIALRDAGNLADVQTRVRLDNGKRLMDRLRALLGGVIADENMALSNAQTRMNRDASHTALAIVAASLVALITGGLGVALIAQLLGAYRREGQLLRDAQRAERASREKSE